MNKRTTRRTVKECELTGPDAQRGGSTSLTVWKLQPAIISWSSTEENLKSDSVKHQ